LVTDLRFEHLDADIGPALTRVDEAGTVHPVDLNLKPGVSRVASVSIGFDRDTRADPILPYNGSRAVLLGEFGATWLGGSYNFASGLAYAGKWWALGSVRHVLSVQGSAGIVLGNAPLFDRLYVGDLNRMLTPRAMGLVLSTRPARDFLGTSSDEQRYGEIGGVAEVQYSYRLFRRSKHIYGGDLFVGAGLWALGSLSELSTRDTSIYKALPLDLMVDVGLRLDTEIGIFELGLANALGRVPF
jgi:outer membrane protein assembly factor BamA